MPENDQPTPAGPAAPAAQPNSQEPASLTSPVDDGTDWKAEARKWETRAKENAASRDALDKARKASMSEAEKAIAEAEERGRRAANTEAGKRLALASFEAAAAKRNPGDDVTKRLAYLDMARFVDEHGEVNTKAIAAAVVDLVPEASGAAPRFEGGPRAAAPSGAGMNDLIRRAAGRA